MAIPYGSYSSELSLDNDGLVDREVLLRLKMTVSDEGIIFDFAGTSDQVAGARNMPLNATLAGVYYAVKALLDPDLPVNSGAFRCIKVIARKGTVFNASPPAAVGDRAATGNILGDLIFAAMAQADTSRVMAGCGPYHGLIISGLDPRKGEYFVDYETFAGASGALDGLDGRDAVRVHVSGSANLPVESLEQEYPVAVMRYELVPDSGGPGRWRGGLSTRRDIALLGDDLRISGRGLRQLVPAFGLFDGGEGRVGDFILDGGNEARRRLGGSFSELPVKNGAIVTVQTPSGGGYGDASRRDPAAVLQDVIDGKVSAEAAVCVYRVAIINGGVDQVATEALRAGR